MFFIRWLIIINRNTLNYNYHSIIVPIYLILYENCESSIKFIEPFNFYHLFIGFQWFIQFLRSIKFINDWLLKHKICINYQNSDTYLSKIMAFR
jgi:hypothetical protein